MGACAECGGGNTIRMGPAGFRPLSKKAAREEDWTVLLMLGRDDLVLSAYLNWSTGPSDIDTSTWRNRISLRVRSPRRHSPRPGHRPRRISRIVTILGQPQPCPQPLGCL